MTTTVSNGVLSVVPILMEGYVHDRASANVIHQIIGAAEASVSLHPAGMRRGSFTLVFSSETDARLADTIHAGASVLTITHTDMTAANMSYVLDGAARLSQDDTRTVWTLAIDFQEVSP